MGRKTTASGALVLGAAGDLHTHPKASNRPPGVLLFQAFIGGEAVYYFIIEL